MKRLLPLLPVVLVLPACSNMPDVTSHLTPYRIDVRQGNFVSQEMVARLKPGLTREQVRFILGTPLVTDLFHADRWDYVYRFQPGHGEVESRHLIVYFENDKLARLGGDIVASPAVDGDAAKSDNRVVDVPPAEAGAPADAPVGKE